MTIKGTFATLFLGLALATSADAALIVGNPAVPGEGDCAPFGCIARYQQAYSASLFSGPMAISSLTFYNTMDSPGTFDPSTFVITLSTSLNPVGSLSATFASNVGADVVSFFNGTLSGSPSPSFTITGTSVFNYDPANGDLLIEVAKSGTFGTFSLFNDYNDDFAGFERVFGFDSSADGSVESNFGLVTGFNVSDAPEPATFGMAGLALVVFAVLRRRQ